MSGIDWSKAPHDAEGAMVAQFANSSIQKGVVEFVPRGGWKRSDYVEGPDAWLYVEKPTAWNGQGLPPVGIDCETLWSSTTGEYVAVRVVAHDEDRAVVRFIGSDRKGEYDSDRQHNNYGYPIFRPMRSAEERAAEQALNQFIDELTKVTCIRRGEAKLIYEAGYRKVQL